jgi:putative sterol carrier protein
MADDIDVTQVSPEQFAELVAQAGDDDIAATIRAAGTEQVLDRIFEGMRERFLPERAQDVDAQIQWIVTDDGDEHHYVTTIRDRRCELDKKRVEQPKAALTTDIVSFVKLITGKAQGPQLFMAGKLKVAGDLMFSQRITSFFDRPGG